MNAGARTGSSAFLILQIEMPNPFRAPVCGCRHRIDGNLGKELNPLTMRIHYSLYKSFKVRRVTLASYRNHHLPTDGHTMVTVNGVTHLFLRDS